MTPDTSIAAPPRRRLGQGVLSIIGLGVAAVLAAAAIAGWSLTTAGPVGSATSGRAGTTATPIPIPIPRTIELNHTFKSQSGNVWCSVGTFSGQAGAICQQHSINYAIPSGACPTEAGGVFVGVGPSGAYWPCVSGWREPAEAIAYDAPVTQSSVTCTINLDAGVKCVNADGHGFTMEYDAGISTF